MKKKFFFILFNLLFFISYIKTTIYTVYVGSQSVGDFYCNLSGFSECGAYGLPYFFPDNITISIGDTISFTLMDADSHTILFSNGSFLALQNSENFVNPASIYKIGGNIMNSSIYKNEITSSGFLGLPGQMQEMFNIYYPMYMNSSQLNGNIYNMTFIEEGTYQYYCIYHTPYMVGWVNVINGTPPFTPKEIINNQLELINQTWYEIDKIAESQGLDKPTNPITHSTIHTNFVRVGYGGFTSQGIPFSLKRFTPPLVSINAGENITFYYEDIMEHTVTLNNSNYYQPMMITYPNYSIQMNSILYNPSSSFIYYDGFITSGLLNTKRNNVTFYFMEPGVFNYQCVIHNQLGMYGLITVSASYSIINISALLILVINLIIFIFI